MLKGLINRIFYSYKSVNNLKHFSSIHKNQFFKMSTATQIPTPQPNQENNYKLLYVENIPRDWNEEDIKSRFQQIGNVEKVHIIKNALGDPTGKIVVHYEKIENIVNAIEKFHNKCPDLKPLKLKFFRKLGQTKENSNQLKNVLLIKNLPYEVTIDDMKLMLQGVAEPIHISLPRDEEGEVRGFAYVYFADNEIASKVFKFLHMRYVKDRQLFVSYTRKAYDISDFRTRKELGIKLDSKFEKEFLLNQIYALQAEEQEKNNDKLEYLIKELRKLHIDTGKSVSVVPVKIAKK